MSKDTNIEWADSSLNLQMGCDGCELRNLKAGINSCYAGTLTDRYGGTNKGFPKSFEEPVLFLDRIVEMMKWKTLTGKERPKKPWLDGLPRIVFLNDMGDTFTESLPLDWMAEKCLPMECPKGHKPPQVQFLKKGTHTVHNVIGDPSSGSREIVIEEDVITCSAAGCMKQWKPSSVLDILSRSVDQYLLLTKRPHRMAEFSKKHPLPPNVWPGTSITSQGNMPRLYDLLKVQGGGPRWLSVEPLLGELKFPRVLWCRHHQCVEREAVMNETMPCFRGQADLHDMIDWMIVGGESGADARPMNPDWARSLKDYCEGNSIPFFMKQMDKVQPIPDDLLVRQMPKFPIIIGEGMALDLSKSDVVVEQTIRMHKGASLIDPKRAVIGKLETINCEVKDVTIQRERK